MLRTVMMGRVSNIQEISVRHGFMSCMFLPHPVMIKYGPFKSQCSTWRQCPAPSGSDNMRVNETLREDFPWQKVKQYKRSRTGVQDALTITCLRHSKSAMRSSLSQLFHSCRVPTDQGNQGIQGKFWRLFPVREIREKQGVFSQNQGKKFQIRELFFQTIFKPFKPINLRKMFFKTVKP